MMTKNSVLYIFLFVLLFAAHFAIWHYEVNSFNGVFYKYYAVLAILFFTVVFVMNFVKGSFFNYLGFTFLGLTVFKLAIILLMFSSLDIKEIPNYKVHFILPYLVTLFLETIFSINLIKSGEKS